MTTYTIQADKTSQSTPVLEKGPVSIYASVTVYFVVGEHPEAGPKRCALIPAGEIRKLRLPTKCCRIAVMAVNDPGAIIITEEYGGASSSCS